MYTQHGKANVDWFSDEQIALRSAANKSNSSIKDKILPQGKRLQTLRSQMVELEQSYKAGEMDISEYSILRDCVVAKLQRAEVLYKKAIAAKPIKTEDEYEEDEVVLPYNSCDVDYTHTEVATSCGVSWIDDLSRTNSFRPICVVICKTVVLLLKLKNYLNRVIKENE
jgi:hypothetical protein